MDQLTSMDVFVRVVEKRGFAAVARALNLSATMVGKHIRFLEERLGTRLLNRTTRRQSLTEAGALYYERCKQLLVDAAEADRCVETLRQIPRGVLRIFSPVTFGSQRLTPVLAEFLAAHPEVRIELTLGDQPVDLVEHGYDAAIRIGELEDSSQIACPLRPYRMLVCAAPRYLKQHGTPKNPADLSRHNCLGFLHWDHRHTWRLFAGDAEQTVHVHGNFSANHGQALRLAALAGAGIVMQPEALLGDDVTAGRLVPVLPNFSPPSRPMHLLYLSDRRVTPKLRSFVNFVVEKFGATPGDLKTARGQRRRRR